MSEMYINYGVFEQRATAFKNYNDRLLEDLHEIQSYVHDGTIDDWISDSAITIRSKIIGMENRFQQYYNVVQNYVTKIRNIAQEYEATEKANDSNAQQFL